MQRNIKKIRNFLKYTEKNRNIIFIQGVPTSVVRERNDSIYGKKEISRKYAIKFFEKTEFENLSSILEFD